MAYLFLFQLETDVTVTDKQVWLLTEYYMVAEVGRLDMSFTITS